MPLFGGFLNKFSPKRAPIRKNPNINNNNIEELKDLVINQRQIELKLGDQKLQFENGVWIPESGHNSNTYRTNQKLKKRIDELQEENNLLRLKYSIMLKMLTQSTVEVHLQEEELQRLRNKN